MKRFFSLILLISLFFKGYSQNNEQILFSVGDENVPLSEFIYTYNKNGDITKATEEEIKEYLDLYINFKLKVKEALALQMDTTILFRQELTSYRNQSAQQYLIDKEVTDALVQEAVDRSKLMLRAAHILIECPSTATGKDTLAAYNKAISIREEVMNGLPFDEAAVKYSQDPSVRDRVNPQSKKLTYGNKGDLGYFTTFNLIYPFESAVYKLKVGEVSMPIRTSYGYHIIYLKDIQPAVTALKVAQIFLKDSTARSGVKSEDMQSRLSDITMRLAKGENFEDVAKAFSEDEATKDKGGVMEAFRPIQRPGDFVQAVLAVPQDGITAPIASNLGWHIVKNMGVAYVDTTESSLTAMVKTRISRDSRSFKSRESLADKLKVEYDFKDKGKKAAFKFLLKNIPENYFKNPDTTKLHELPGIEKLAPIATFANEKLSVADFAKYLSRFQGVEMKGELEKFMEERYNFFIYDKILIYENNNLEKKYPEFKNLVQEYHDGMLLYEINSKYIWNKSLEDSVGVEKFYEETKMQYPDKNNPGAYLPFSEVRAAVITQYQNKLEEEWLSELRKKYPIVVNEKMFQSLLDK